MTKPNDVSLLTPWKNEAASALANYGFSSDDSKTVTGVDFVH